MSFSFHPSQGIPREILKPFNEAVQCHANNCYMASAVMVRKTLEMLCELKGAEGMCLIKKIDDLPTKVGLPQVFFEGMHEIRFIGNEAAHVDLKDIDNVGEEEAKLAIEMTYRIIQCSYQAEEIEKRLEILGEMDTIVERLQALKNLPPTS